MKRNIIKELLENVSPKFIANTAQTFQETENGIREGLKNLVPTIFYQLNHKMDGDSANEFFQFLKKEKDTSFDNHLNGVLDNKDAVQVEHKNTVNDFVENLFGNRQKNVLDFISQKNHLRANSSQALMTVGSTLVIGYLNKVIRGEGLNLNSFKQLLAGQEGKIEEALPLGISKWLGNIRPLTAAASSTASTQVASKGAATAYASQASAASDTAVAGGAASLGWAKWLLLIPILLLGLWFFMGADSSTNSTETIAEAKPAVVTQSKPVVEEPTEKEDALIKATEEFAKKDAIASSTAVQNTENSNNTVPTVKPKREKEQLVTIHPPVKIEDDSFEAQSSPGGGVNSTEFRGKGQSSNNTASTTIVKESMSNSDITSSSGAIAEESKKISYEDYTRKVKMPKSAKTIASSIEKQTTTSRPDWYTKSKKIVDGNSGNVSIIKKVETVLEGSNRSQLAMLRKSLPLEKYNAWFGYITNPISSTEYRLYSYLNDTQKTIESVDQYTWFNLDEVKYKSYSSQMDYDASKGQLTRIANILSANPNVQLKVGGFTSDQGRKKANRKLSLEMAEQTKAALVKLGVDESRISVKGYGESQPLGLNDTEAGRMKNHRVGFRVMSK